ncbi:methyltransferase domain-containing protein [bacterium]|nr:methyltransferase domain-containing protein [bacterium]
MTDRSGAGAPCPCCAARIDGPPAFVHPAIPRLLNVLAASEAEARQAPAGRLELVECPACGMVFNRAFAGVPYGQDYFLDATRSPRYRRHLDDVSDRIAARLAPRDRFSLVDVGAGQGLFLAHLVERLGDRVIRAQGFDPAFRAAEATLPARVAVRAAPLDAAGAAALEGSVDVVAARHVFEHIPDPVRFLASFREHVPGPFELVLETPDVDHTLARGLLHDFCYEHCAMATDAAVAAALRRAGYQRIRVERAFDDEYLLAFATAPPGTERAAAPAPPTPRGAAPRLAALAARFAPRHRERLRQARARGPVALWGAAGKGALFALLVDPERTLLDLVVDIHPRKQGGFLPGAGHRVVAPEAARDAGVRTVLVANPTYAGEVATMCASLGLRAEVQCAGDPAGAAG